MRRPNPNVRYPVFKFQKIDHAKMMFDGTVRISKISDFRDKEKHKNQILDEGEGTAIFIGHNYTTQIEINNQYIFCATEHFLSDSLLWAISEGKECCVMVTDPEEFYKRITNNAHVGLTHSGSAPCTYVTTRTFTHEAYFQFLAKNNNLNDICFLKPYQYLSQRETRSAWQPQEDTNAECLYIQADIRDLLINIEFKRITESKFHSGKTVTVTTHLKNKETRIVNIKTAQSVHTPIIIKLNDVDCLGYRISGTNAISNGKASADVAAMYFDGNMLIAGINELKDIEKIEFSYN